MFSEEAWRILLLYQNEEFPKRILLFHIRLFPLRNAVITTLSDI